jgi:hypothetical protein
LRVFPALELLAHGLGLRLAEFLRRARIQPAVLVRIVPRILEIEVKPFVWTIYKVQ